MMISEATIVPATREHAVALAQSMRPADVAEVEAAGQEPLIAVLESIERSEVSWALLHDGVVGTIIGVGPVSVGSIATGGEVGQLWFLTAHSFGKHPRPFMRAIRRIIKTFHTRYPCSSTSSTPGTSGRCASRNRWAHG